MGRHYGLHRAAKMRLLACLLLAVVASVNANAEPEAEADPYYFYSGLYGGYRGYAGYPYRAYGGYYGYRPYSYGLWGRKKREAEPTAAAEPAADAEADPWYLYSGHYGYGYYGYRPYCGGYYGWGGYYGR